MQAASIRRRRCAMSDPSATPVPRCAGLGKRYERSGQHRGVDRRDLQRRAGETVAIVGASGSGKARCCICWVASTHRRRAAVTLMGESLAALSDAARGDLRNRALGFVYQFHHAARRTDRGAERCPCVAHPAHAGRRRRTEGTATARDRWPGPSPAASAVRAFWRRTAARRHRPRW